MSITLNNGGYESQICSVNGLLSGATKDAMVGLVIPEYQRIYTWEPEQIERFFLDILSGVSSRIQKKTNTFLGATVWCKRKRADLEPNFNPTSYDIVDGQQRITTCILMAISLICEIKQNRKKINETLELPDKLDQWLDQEESYIIEELQTLIYGEVGAAFNRKLFPRVINEEDVRSASPQHSVYKSPIAETLMSFISYLEQIDQSESTEFDIKSISIKSEYQDVFQRLCRNLEKFFEFLKQLSSADFYSENNIQFVSPNDLLKAPLKELLHHKNYPEGEFRKFVENEDVFSHHVRLLHYSGYFSRATCFTVITCEDEDAAFSIFDALNTTGVPLTAIETLKPYVLRQYASEKTTFSKSKAEKNFETIERIVRSTDNTVEQQSRISKETVTHGALLASGETLGLNLAAQRNKLRQIQDKCKGNDDIDLTSEILAKVAKYKEEFFSIGKIRDFTSHGLTEEQQQQIKLVSALISESRSALLIPLLTRFYWDGEQRRNFLLFHEACLAIGAFYVLRRATTTTTASIDGTFRAAMSGNSTFAGMKLDYESPQKLTENNLNELKEFLQTSLSSSQFRFTINDKAGWVHHAKEMTHYTNNAKTLLKFMLLAAHDGTKIDLKDNTLIDREDAVQMPSRDFLTFSSWNKDLYKTLEHVAPQNPRNPQGDGWNNVYRDSKLKHTIGNFVLLPQKQNSALSNANWEVKKLFLKVLLSDSINDRKTIISSQSAIGIKLPSAIEKEVLKPNGPYAIVKAEMLSGLENVDQWDAIYLKKRSERLTALAWDGIIGWLK